MPHAVIPKSQFVSIIFSLTAKSPGTANAAMVASAMQRKFSRTASLSQSSSRSGSLSDISCDGEQLDMDESPTHRQQKYTQYVHNLLYSLFGSVYRNVAGN